MSAKFSVCSIKTNYAIKTKQCLEFYLIIALLFPQVFCRSLYIRTYLRSGIFSVRQICILYLVPFLAGYTLAYTDNSQFSRAIQTVFGLFPYLCEKHTTENVKDNIK